MALPTTPEQIEALARAMVKDINWQDHTKAGDWLSLKAPTTGMLTRWNVIDKAPEVAKKLAAEAYSQEPRFGSW